MTRFHGRPFLTSGSACRLLTLLLVSWVTCGPLVAQDRATELLRFVPDDANAIAIVRLQELVDSPVGRDEDWQTSRTANYLEGSVTLPPWVTTLVRASHVRPGVPGGEWSVGLLTLPRTFELEGLASREASSVQTISGHKAVWSQRRNGYFVELVPAVLGKLRVLGIVSPATRQDVVQWIDFASQTEAPVLRPYLAQAADPELGEVVIAMDLSNLFDPGMIEHRLRGSAHLLDQPELVEPLLGLFTTLEGIRLAVRADEKLTAEIQIDFGKEVGDLGPHVKPLFLEYVYDSGATLDELAESEVGVEETSVALTMEMSEDSLRRVLSLVTSPGPHAMSPGAEAPGQEPVSSRVDVAATRRYYQAVNRNLDDLQRAYRKARNYSHTHRWHENFAHRIEQLPTAGVDSDVVDYGLTTARHLRALAASLQGLKIQVNALDRSIYYHTSVQPFWAVRTVYGPYGAYSYTPSTINVDTNLHEIRAKQSELIAESAPQRQDIWQMIIDDRARVRQELLNRYGFDFDKPGRIPEEFLNQPAP